MSEAEPQQEQEQPRNEQEPRVTPKVWIASLSDYNNGHLHGAWVDAGQEPDYIWEGVNEVLRTSREPGAEEWAIFDYEGFGPLRLSEYESVERISKLGLGIAEHGVAFAAFASYLGHSDTELLDQFGDCYLGRWESAEAYAEALVDDMGINRLLDEHVPQGMREYVQVDADSMAIDMEMEGALLSVDDSEGGVFLFHPP